MPKSKRPSAKASKKPPKTPSQQKEAVRGQAYYQANRAEIRRKQTEARAAESPVTKIERVWRRQAKPATPRTVARTPEAQRRHAVARAFCDWADTEEMYRTYRAAAVMTELTGETYCVDHLVPIQNPLVCGLHTHTNLQVIRADENRMKGNWIWPDMWPVDEGTLELLDQALAQQRASPRRVFS